MNEKIGNNYTYNNKKRCFHFDKNKYKSNIQKLFDFLLYYNNNNNDNIKINFEFYEIIKFIYIYDCDIRNIRKSFNEKEKDNKENLSYMIKKR